MKNKLTLYSRKIKVEKKANLPALKDANLPAIPTFDLSQLTSLNLAGELRQTLNKPAPSRCTFLWGGKRQLKRLELDAEHQRWVLTQINNLRDINSALINLQAEMFLTVETVTLLINNRRREAQQQAELSIKYHEATLYAIDKQMEIQDLTNDRLRAEIEQIRTVTDAAKTRIELMKAVVEKIDLSQLPDYLKAFIIASVFNPDHPISNEMQLMDDLRQFTKQRAKAEADKATAEATTKKAQAKRDDVEAEVTIRDIKKYL